MTRLPASLSPVANLRKLPAAIVFLVTVLLVSAPLQAQWTHHYPKLNDFGHQLYLEQHELPILSHGPVDPAPAPDGERLAFAARGWIWIMELSTGVAERVTGGPHVDSRPRWSPDGTRLAFLRDSGDNTSVVVLELESGEQQLIDTPAIELDPEFSADGQYLFYTSGASGSLELRRHHLQAGLVDTLTDLSQVVRNVRRLAGDRGVLYLHGAGAQRVLRERNFITGTDRIVHSETLAYHLTADTHPTQRLIVYSAPIDNDYHLWTIDLDDPVVKHRLTDGSPYALTPAFSADGDEIYYADLGPQRQFRIMRLPTYGGTAEQVAVTRWNYGEATGSLRLELTDEDGEPVTARVSITRADGHPAAYGEDATYVDPQTGHHYFYVEGESRFTFPEGHYTILAARGPMAPVVQAEVRIREGRTEQARLAITEIWDAREAGYASADHHIHLNGDGHHRAGHEDALRLMAGEDLDMLSPMSWNRWERRIDRSLVGTETTRGGRTVQQGQEIRSHFHGHIGLLDVETPFSPWFFGPQNPTLGDPDLTNGDVLAYADRNGAFATYVHPIGTDRDPFTHLEEGPIPLELISDAVLSERMGLELVCTWTSPLGASELWYRLLNIGKPVAAMSGTDGWVDFHRTPAVGTARTYVRLAGGEPSPDAIIEAAASGRSFVTTGPALMFELEGGIRPGEVAPPGMHRWELTLAATADIPHLEILVNGEVVARPEGIKAGERRTVAGEVRLPAGGWIAARAYGVPQEGDSWPSMHARPFAHSSPIWIGEVGSVEEGARAGAAADLIRAIDAAKERARTAYGEVETPRMLARLEEVRERLWGMLEQEP